MALIFELWAECNNEASLYQLKEYFTGLSHQLLSGRIIEFSAAIESPYAEAHGLSVWSGDLSRFGIRTFQNALELTEAGLFLYHRLSTAPAFSFARVALEAGIITTVELADSFETSDDGAMHTNLQCVIDDQLYKRLGSPTNFLPFREGYWWRKYLGETYQPLYSNDQQRLNSLCNQFFPGVYFPNGG